MTVATRTATPDAACLAAVDLARDAAVTEAGAGRVGEHVEARADGDRLVTHLFTCLDPAYRGWQWAVTVVRAARAKVVTVDEVVLLPGAESLLPPAWVPWTERLRPGDLGIGDLLPTSADDVRLVPTFLSTDDEDADTVAFELGLGRARVLSPEGREQAVERWYGAEPGPDAPIAKAAPGHCASCGFFLPLAGSLRQAFGVCANEYAPDDGRVVAVDHGCGAHSEAVVAQAGSEPAPPLLDELAVDIVAVAPAAHAPGSVDDADRAEDLGHS